MSVTKTSSVCLLDLPNELLMKVFEGTHNVRDLHSLAGTNKHFSEMAAYRLEQLKPKALSIIAVALHCARMWEMSLRLDSDKWVRGEFFESVPKAQLLIRTAANAANCWTPVEYDKLEKLSARGAKADYRPLLLKKLVKALHDLERLCELLTNGDQRDAQAQAHLGALERTIEAHNEKCLERDLWFGEEWEEDWSAYRKTRGLEDDDKWAEYDNDSDDDDEEEEDDDDVDDDGDDDGDEAVLQNSF